MSALVHEQASDELKNEYRENGVVKIEQVVSDELLEKLSSVADSQLANPGPWVTDTNPGATEGRLFTSRYRWETDPAINDFVFKSEVGGIAAALMESSSSRFYFDHLLIKEPLTANPTPWHQDVPYWPFLGKQICSAWVAITEAKVADSSLEFVRGSHAWGSYYAPEAFDGKDGWASEFEGEKCPDIEASRSEYEIVGFDVKPGDAIFFSAWIIHGSPGNSGAKRRAALSTRWLGDDVTWFPHAGCDPTVTDEDTSSVTGQYPDDNQRFPLIHCA